MQISKAQRRMINAVSLAEKHEVSPEYVRKILSGERDAKSEKAIQIVNDAKRIIETIEAI